VRGDAGEEPGRGGAFLVGVDLGMGEAGVIINCGVDVVEPDAAATDLFLAAMDPPAAAVREGTQFLHVAMGQITGAGALA